jgi:hypothetical protein
MIIERCVLHTNIAFVETKVESNLKQNNGFDKIYNLYKNEKKRKKTIFIPHKIIIGFDIRA